MRQNENYSKPSTPNPEAQPSIRGENNSRSQNSSEPSSENQPIFQAPTINLPKGGGAIQGIGEKFQANPVTGTGSMTVPIAMSPGRGGFTPQLALSYDSGAGNSPFGLGWNIGLPSITRKTSKGLPEYDGLPKYYDAFESDVFILSGAEDLVPVLTEDGSVYERIEGEYKVYRYIPRIEGLFARIEKWINQTDKSSFWKSITKENITTIYGKSSNAKIVDPKDNWKVFQWKIEQTSDDKGNVILYEYKKEDGIGFPPKPIFEKNRNEDNAYNQTYLKRVLYGNTILYSNPNFDTDNKWFFELIFDYGEHSEEGDQVPSYEENYDWLVRPDIFSSFRSGFDIRTYRLCQQILMYHHFEPELGIPNYLVKSTRFDFEESPILTHLKSITHTGYRWDGSNYTKKSYPPVEFQYTQQKIDHTIYEIHSNDLPNAPQGIDGQSYQFNDLYGEGLNGILSQKNGAWYYKRNEGNGTFGAQELVAEIPSIALNANVQVTDFGGDGLTDVVVQNGTLNGYFELSEEKEWSNFKQFNHPVNFDLNDPNLRQIDLDGNGIPDIIVSENDCFIWYPSDAKDGFKTFKRIYKALDEEQGARIVFSERFQTIFLADMSGDGLTDIVRIRNNEICYWANMGYGKFSYKITMQDSPHFDLPDYFDPGRIRLADIDGSGSTDVLYLGRDKIEYWLNQSGNSWGTPKYISKFPKTSNLHTVSVFDLLGNGTSCIVWSSPLPAEAQTPMKYIKLMGNNQTEGNKPYLLKEVNNNMGAITRMKYDASTKFYLEDQKQGKPWITKLPFPVQVLSRVETFDEIAMNSFVARYAYHHGYFDKVEREFRGFGMVEQWDTEDYETLSKNSLFDNIGQNWSEEYDEPPVYTKTWFHNGYYKQGKKITRQYENEYYHLDAEAWQLTDTELPSNLNFHEKREAFRALRGRLLRVEVYGLDGKAEVIHPYTVAETKYQVKTIQQQGENRYASFYVCECESLSYQYERNPNDPRIAHQTTLEIDSFGNVLKSAAIVYPRRSTSAHPEQNRIYTTYTETDFINKSQESDFYRIGVPFAQRSFEVTGLTLNYPFEKSDLKNAIASANVIPYEQAPNIGIEKRLVNSSKSSFYNTDLSSELAFGEIAFHALPFQSYEAVYTQGLIDKFIKDGTPLISAAELETAGGFIPMDNLWWRTSGRAIFNASQFYLPIEQLDPFGHSYQMDYDTYHLAMVETSTAIYDKTIVSKAQLNYRTLQPFLLTDPNGNRSEIIFDELGMVIATAIMGKDGSNEGDSLAGYNRFQYPDQDFRHDIFDNRMTYLQTATTFFYYDLNAWKRDQQSNHAISIVREVHNDPSSQSQINFTYSDGLGQTIMVKVQAEPGDAFRLENGNLVNDFAATRWVGNGRTVFNNKGNPIKQYEPYFSHNFDYETETELVEYGVTPILRYDALERNIRTDLPDRSFTKVEFTPWQQSTFDQNDTVLESQWFIDRGSPDPNGSEPNVLNNPSNYNRRAAWLAAQYANTPKVEHIDTLGRVFLMEDDNGIEGIYRTHFKLDIQGNQVEVTDAKDRLITRNHFNMAKEPIFTESMDAGRRWNVINIIGNPIFQWNDRSFKIRLEYDDLQRNTATFVQETSGTEHLVYSNVFGERLADPEQSNHYGQLYQLYDQAGSKTSVSFDFKGNPVQMKQQVCKDYKNTIDWSILHGLTDVADIQSQAANFLEDEVFTTAAEFDALNRPSKTIAPDASETIYTYNEANFINKIQTRLRGSTTITDFVKNIDYDSKGQRTKIQYGNGVTTTYEYEPETFRLSRLRSTRSSDNAILQDLKYHYDPIGNITDIRDDAQQNIFFNNTLVEPHSSYTYDALYRLIKTKGREHPGQTSAPGRTHKDFEASTPIPHANDGQVIQHYTRTYHYDELGNMLLVKHNAASSGWSRTYEYNEPSLLENGKINNRLSKTILTNPGSAQTYTYDIHGNMTSMPHLFSMIWDFADQLKEVDLGGGGKEYYTYTMGGGKDFGVRARKVTERPGGKICDRIYIGDYEVYRERTIANGVDLERSTLHIQDDKGRIALVDTLTIENQALLSNPQVLQRYQLSNHLGSSYTELEETGDLISYEEYYPFGASSYRAGRSASEVAFKRYRYVGKERDISTRFDYYGARYYGSWLGRWIKPDPAGFIDGYNLYHFVQANPIRMMDLEGKKAVKDEKTPNFAEDFKEKHKEAIAKEWDINAIDTGKEAFEKGEITEFERQLIIANNKARTNPAKFAEEAILPLYEGLYEGNYEGKKVWAFDGRVQESAKAIEEAITELGNTNPLPILKFSSELTSSAKSHTEDAKNTGITGHKSSWLNKDGKPASVVDRALKFLDFESSFKASENISYNRKEDIAIEHVRDLIIDGGVPDRGHRKNILNPEWTDIGVSHITDHPNTGQPGKTIMSVTNFATPHFPIKK